MCGLYLFPFNEIFFLVIIILGTVAGRSDDRTAALRESCVKPHTVPVVVRVELVLRPAAQPTRRWTFEQTVKTKSHGTAQHRKAQC